MKIKTNIRPLASVMVLTLLMAFVIGTALGAYLLFVSQQNLSIARSMAWNNAMAVAESGIEEGLSQVNLCGFTNAANRTANGWTTNSTDTWYHKSRSFADGSYYSVNIQPNDPPIIISSGCFVAPANTRSFTFLGLLTGQVTGDSSTPRYTKRTVRITTNKPLSQGTAGFKAKGQITFSGAGSLDSYDSRLGPYTVASRRDHAKAITNAKAADSIKVDTARIYGSVQTGPGGTVRTALTGAVGDLAWNTGHTGIEPGQFTDDADMRFDDVPVPFTAGYSTLAFGSGSYSYNGTNYTAVLGDGDYQIGTLSIGSGKSLAVTGKARLYVTGTFVTALSGFVYVAPGASLELYCGGNFTVTGTGIVNGGGATDKLTVFGLKNSVNAVYGGTSTFVGSVNMPYAAFTFSSSAGAYGSFTASTISVSGTAAVHIDEALGASPSNGYVATSWNEVEPNAPLN